MSIFSRPRLGEILVERGAISHADVESACQGARTGRVGEHLLALGKIDEAQLAAALADQLELTCIDLEDFTIPSELYAVLPAMEAFRCEAVPYAQSDSRLQVVLADPLDFRLQGKLGQLTGKRLDVLVGTRSQIRACLKRSQGSSEILKGVTQGFKSTSLEESLRSVDSAGALDILDPEAGPIVRLINSILADALQRRASDVHIEAYEDSVLIKYRVDGVMYSATEALDRQHHDALVTRLKVMAELDIAEKRVPQDGRFKLMTHGRDIDFRVSILPSVFGEDVVIRVLDRGFMANDMRSLSLDTLGMVPDVLRTFRKAVREPYGMVLITGPTGSGKTTTLYAALTELNDGEEKIITIEDPVEYMLDGVVQIPVNEKKKLTFATGLRSILRHDPDKIMVGEIRDVETAQIAVQSALTGHLVFTTVHANNAFDVIGRFSHMGVDVYAFVSALNCVMAQRLMRTICSQCRHEVEMDAELLEASGLAPALCTERRWYEGRGCTHCGGTGYRGRVAITELLDLSSRMRELIIDRRPLSEMRAQAAIEGMITLRESAIAKVFAGETTLREANRVTFVE
jgi:type IV pilus assembly protein PilB